LRPAFKGKRREAQTSLKPCQLGNGKWRKVTKSHFKKKEKEEKEEAPTIKEKRKVKRSWFQERQHRC